MENKKIEILKTAYEYIDKLIEGIKNIVEEIQEGNEYEAIVIIPNVAEGMEWLINSIKLTEDIQTEPIDLDSLNQQLKELIEAFENEDYILIGDIFNYELIPILNEFKDKISICIK
ncbi:MAG: hypothetical protein ACLSTJ_16270 [Clostridium neonatale]